MSSRRTLRNLGTGKKRPETRDAVNSATRNTEDKKIEVPGIHRLGPGDTESHFGKDNKPNTTAQNEGPSKDPDSSEPELSGNVRQYADIHLPIEKRLWRQVQIAAAKKSIDPSRFVEMALEVVLNSDE